jgi:DNA-binding beta-propeller fold protein YncE
MTKDEQFLYVALLGFNAVAKIDIKSSTTIGLIPTGWGTTRVVLSNDESHLYITSCRGLGAGPNGGKNFTIPKQGTYIGDIQLGSFQDVINPDENTLAAYTKQTLAQTYIVKEQTDSLPLPVLPGSIYNKRKSNI